MCFALKPRRPRLMDCSRCRHRGVVEPEENEAEPAALETQIHGSLEEALIALVASRETRDGLWPSCSAAARPHCDLTAQANALPARQPERCAARSSSKSPAVENADSFDSNRRIRSGVAGRQGRYSRELDRLAHIDERTAHSGRRPGGRRLDFLGRNSGNPNTSAPNPMIHPDERSSSILNRNRQSEQVKISSRRVQNR